MVDHPPAQELAARTLHRVKDALGSGQAVGLPELVKLIQTMSSDPQSVDIETLAQIVQKDPVILAKVLGAAQTMAYNISGAHVSSLAQAIHLVGYARIRAITMTLLITGVGGGQPSTDEHREAAAAAVCSGFVAESVAEQLGLCDREEAYIGACLRNLGNIVLAAFMAEEYRAARADVLRPSDEAWRAIVGLTPLELGRELLNQENAPPDALRCLDPFDPRHAASRGRSAQPLVAVCDLSSKLAAISVRAGDTEAIAPGMKAVVSEYAAIFPEIAERMDALLAEAGAHLREFLRDRKISSLPEAMVGRFSRRARAFGQAAPTASSAARKSGGQESARTAPARPEVPLHNLTHNWASAQERLIRLAAEPDVPPARVLAQAVQLLRGGFGGDEVIVFSGRSSQEAARLTFGAGEFFLQLPGRVAVADGERTVAGICLKFRENVFVHDARDPNIALHLPPWLKLPGAPRSFALFPLLGASRLAGLVLVGWNEPRRLSLAPDSAASLGKFLAALGTFCEANP